MDLWQLIRSEHASTIELCREILHSSGRDRDRMFRHLQREVERQMQAKDRVLFSMIEGGDRSGRPHADIRNELRDLSRYHDKGSPEWTRRFEDFVSMLENHFELEEHSLGAALGMLGREEEDDLRRRFQREKIAVLQAQRRHLPVALMPRRYGLSDRAALGFLAAIAVTAAAGAVWLSRSEQERTPRRSRRRRLSRSDYFSTDRRSAMRVREMISTHPDVKGNVNEALIRCIEECYSCAQTCTSCADACLGESMVAQLKQCIRLNLDCADVCAATGAVASRRTGSNEEVIRRMLEACATACRLCGDECQKHAGMHEHCRICAESCRRCEEACQEALRSMR